ncbi:MAG: hypothetical protein IT559_03335 [Alphaproteobacteria bacterium]|nr:hypothetical protein [Alphaproteobacteria bacterium]
MMSSTSKKFDAAHKVSSLPVTGEYVTDPHNVSCPVLDTDRIDFESSQSGRKKATTRVLRVPDSGIKTMQIFNDTLEGFPYDAQPGDALFVNSPTDMYVPPSTNGGRLKFKDLEKNGFKIMSGDSNEVQVKSPPAQLLVGIVQSRVCIKNAWGSEDKPENHQFLSPGATLKQGGDGKVTGIDKEGFEKWEIDADQNSLKISQEHSP